MTRDERFAEMARIHAGSVLAYLRRRHYGDGSTGPEDVLADVLIVAWRRFDDIPEGLEAPWLFGVARRCLANDRRKTRRRRAFIMQLRPSDGGPSAEDEVMADFALAQALDALSETEREVLLLASWEGLNPTELAAALGVSENAAAVRLSKAKAKLKTKLMD